MTKQDSKTTKTYYGGQAVIEGVMIRSPHKVSVSVRNPQKEIQNYQFSLPNFRRRKYTLLPFLRGIFAIVEMFMIGQKALQFSADIADTSSKSEKKTNSILESVTVVVSILIALAIFVLLPLGVSYLFEVFNVIDSSQVILLNTIEQLLRLVLFVGYLVVIRFSKTILRVFAYHGAEHKTIACYEATEQFDDVSKIQKYAKEHVRCGTSFLFTVIVISIITHIFLPRDPAWLTVLTRIALIPVVVSLSYEYIRLVALLNWKILNLTLTPNLWLQKLTTAEPDDDMVEVAQDALRQAIYKE